MLDDVYYRNKIIEAEAVYRRRLKRMSFEELKYEIKMLKAKLKHRNDDDRRYYSEKAEAARKISIINKMLENSL